LRKISVSFFSLFQLERNSESLLLLTSILESFSSTTTAASTWMFEEWSPNKSPRWTWTGGSSQIRSIKMFSPSQIPETIPENSSKSKCWTQLDFCVLQCSDSINLAEIKYRNTCSLTPFPIHSDTVISVKQLCGSHTAAIALCFPKGGILFGEPQWQNFHDLAVANSLKSIFRIILWVKACSMFLKPLM